MLCPTCPASPVSLSPRLLWSKPKASWVFFFINLLYGVGASIIPRSHQSRERCVLPTLCPGCLRGEGEGPAEWEILALGDTHSGFGGKPSLHLHPCELQFPRWGSWVLRWGESHREGEGVCLPALQVGVLFCF